VGTAGSRPARIAALTVIALVAFAANSWLCRAALRTAAIDPQSFTAVRIGSGALVLALLVAARRGNPLRHGDWLSALALFAYAIGFSLAYVRLDTGVGALILFSAVQLTLLVGGIVGGHRLRWREAAGVLLALAGLVLLGAPGGHAPAPPALAGMAAAGVAWGLYTLRGRGSSASGAPLPATAGNFARALPLALVALLATRGLLQLSPRGLTLAAISGGVTSGLGYAVWYAALRGLTPLVAGVVQLAVPVLAALGGVALLGEQLTSRLLGAGALVLGGIGWALVGRR
jgi:drug/metabolite transporter (DMT)-like permease